MLFKCYIHKSEVHRTQNAKRTLKYKASCSELITKHCVNAEAVWALRPGTVHVCAVMLLSQSTHRIT